MLTSRVIGEQHVGLGPDGGRQAPVFARPSRHPRHPEVLGLDVDAGVLDAYALVSASSPPVLALLVRSPCADCTTTRRIGWLHWISMAPASVR
jgi:hypothetical protein